MNRTLREVVIARSSAAGPPASASLELAVEMDPERGLDVRFAAPRQRPADLERTAAEGLRDLSSRLPPGCERRLALEVGRVRSRFFRDGAETPLFARSYRMASCRGVILDLSDLPEGVGEQPAGSIDSPWTGTLAPEQLDPSLPLVLAPSAVLSLVSYALEVTGSHVAIHRTAVLPGLTVVDTASSPYSPQHHPFEDDGTASPDRVLIEEGRWQDREERAGDGVDPLFFLLTRPERALRPLAAGVHFSRRNLTVRCSREAPVPDGAVVVDSWLARVGPRSGVIPFHAELSQTGPAGDRLAVATSVALSLDPWEVLARVEGTAGPAGPAVEEDPIEGSSYGCAPPLVVALRLADLLSEHGSRL